MVRFFLACAVFGGVILLAQIVLGLFGVNDHDTTAETELDHDHGVHHAEGLNLFSVRALSSGVAFFGFGGLAGLSLGGGVLLAAPLAVALGSGALVGVAWVSRAMLRLDDDGTVRIESAIGVSGDVYLTIPASRGGVGKVQVPVQNRLMEFQAVTSHGAALPTGMRVLVVDVAGPDTVDVVPDPIALPNEVSNVAR
jgi:hypothetical protein